MNNSSSSWSVNFAMTSFISFIFLALFIPQNALAQTVEIREHTVEFTGRNYDGATTTFNYQVCRPDGVNPGLDHFVVGFPLCDPVLVVSRTVPGGASVTTDQDSGVFGVLWDDNLDEGRCRDYSVSFVGEVGIGIVNVVVNTGDSGANQIGQLPGASCFDIDQLCTIGNEARMVIMLDQTGSTSNTELEIEKAAARSIITFFGNLATKPYVAIGSFNVLDDGDNPQPTQARIIAPLTNSYGSQNPSTGLYSSIEGISGTSSTTDIQRAIEVAAAELATLPNPNDDPNYIVLISDGVPNRPGNPAYTDCNSCGCTSAYNAGELAATTAEGVPFNATIFAIHYEGSAFDCSGSGEPQDGIDYMRDQIATGVTNFFQGNADLAGVFQVIADQVVCEDNDACRDFACEGDACISTSIVPNDPDATQNGPCMVPGAQGICAMGTYNENCECVGTPPRDEICDDQIDNDCDGQIDDQDPDCFECIPGDQETQSCQTTLPGVCAEGEQTRLCINGFWSNFSACAPLINPGEIEEGPVGDPTCDDNLDNDCDNTTDLEDMGCWECDPGQTEQMACDSGIPGICGPGMKERICGPDGFWQPFGQCLPDSDPQGEGPFGDPTCDDGQDNDCDGLTDPFDPDCFECPPGQIDLMDCDTGDPGICGPGTRSRLCVDGFWGNFGACAANSSPGQEGPPGSDSCMDDEDNDCDGLTDEEDPDCFICAPGMTETEPCDSGLPGVCSDGMKTRTCIDGFWNEFDDCGPNVAPDENSESCNQIDDDCDGEIDEDFDVGGACTVPDETECPQDGTLQCSEDGGVECVRNPDSNNVCLECTDLDITQTLFIMDGNANAQRKIIRRANKMLNKKSDGKFRKFRRQTNALALSLFQESWGVTWAIPEVVTSCVGNTSTCVTVNNTSSIESYNTNSAEFGELLNQVIEKLRKQTGKKKSGKKLVKQNEELNQENLSLTATIPAESFSCN